MGLQSLYLVSLLSLFFCWGRGRSITPSWRDLHAAFSDLSKQSCLYLWRMLQGEQGTLTELKPGHRCWAGAQHRQAEVVVAPRSPLSWLWPMSVDAGHFC